MDGEHGDGERGAGTGHPWETYYPLGCRWDLAIERLTIPEMLDRAVAAWGDRPAFEYGGVEIGFRTFGSHVAAIAAGLGGLGIGAGDTVAILLPNTPWHPIAVAALARIGARVVMMSLLDAPRELAYKLTDSGARTVITTDLAHALPASCRLRDEGVVDRVLLGEDAVWRQAGAPFGKAAGASVISLGAMLACDPGSGAPRAAIDADDIAFIQYTGGTTGLAKGAMLTHANVTAAAQIYVAWKENDRPPGCERVIGVLPLFHIYGLTVVMFANLLDGNMIMLRPGFDAGQTLRDIGTGHATIFSAVPTMWLAMLAHPDIAGTDFSSLANISCGGAPLPTEVAKKVGALTRLPMTNGWGMTETSPAGTRLPAGVAMVPGLIGVPLPRVEMRIVSLDDPARVLGPNETGEIAIAGPNVFVGYWNKDEATRECFCDGFFLTGDIGSMDERGLFSLVDRKKNMIISSGFNVYPAQIEEAIYAHADVAETIVIGVDDAYRGQAAKAFVTMRAGAAPLTLDALRAFLADRIGRHAMPQHLELRDTLPKSAVGKLLAGVLIAEERAKAA